VGAHRNAEQWLARLVAHRTVPGQSNLELVDEVHEFLTSLGASSVVIPGVREGTANLYATLGPETGSGVILSAHTDVVAADGGGWSSEPFVLTRRGERLYGRGATDMKGFIAAVLATLPELDAQALRRPLGLALSADEEVGARGVPALLDVLADRPDRPLWCVVGEPTGMRVAVAHKGKIAFRISVRGAAAHSSLAAGTVSAIACAAEAVCDLYAYQATLAQDAHDDRFAVAHATVNVGRIAGGASVNVVAESCCLEAEIRTLPCGPHDAHWSFVGDVVARMRERMRGQLADADATVEVLCDYPGLNVGGDVPSTVARLAGTDHGLALDFGTEAGLFQQRLDVPVVVCGPGDIAQAHVVDEYINVDELARAQTFVRRIAAWLAR
jgi:acetylornithine deacetylase